MSIRGTVMRLLDTLRSRIASLSGQVQDGNPVPARRRPGGAVLHVVSVEEEKRRTKQQIMETRARVDRINQLHSIRVRKTGESSR